MDAPHLASDDRSDKEILEDKFGDRRHILQRIVETGGPLSDDAGQILEIIGDDAEASTSPASTESAQDTAPYCPSCGEGVAGDDTFCRACGENLDEDSDAPV